MNSGEVELAARLPGRGPWSFVNSGEVEFVAPLPGRGPWSFVNSGEVEFVGPLPGRGPWSFVNSGAVEFVAPLPGRGPWSFVNSGEVEFVAPLPGRGPWAVVNSGEVECVARRLMAVHVFVFLVGGRGPTATSLPEAPRCRSAPWASNRVGAQAGREGGHDGATGARDFHSSLPGGKPGFVHENNPRRRVLRPPRSHATGQHPEQGA